MKSGRKWAVIRDCLKKNRMALLLWGLMLLTELAVFTLYDIMLEPLIYAGALTLFAGLVLLAVQLYGALQIEFAMQIHKNREHVSRFLYFWREKVSTIRRNFRTTLERPSVRSPLSAKL